MAEFETAIAKVARLFNISTFNCHQKMAIRSFVEDKRDVFVNLPTGYGKSLIYQALPFMFDCLSGQQGHIVVVVSPLINLIKDQVNYLQKLGLTAINISAIEQEEKRREFEKGAYQFTELQKHGSITLVGEIC